LPVPVTHLILIDLFATEYSWGGGLLRFFPFREGGIFLETFLEILREVLKGVVRELSTYFFRENVLENKKTTPRRSNQKDGSHK
jgi:hypothetical protein